MLVMAWTTRQRSLIFLPNAAESLCSHHQWHYSPTCSITHLLSTSKTPPFVPAVTTLTPASVFSSSTMLSLLPAFPSLLPPLAAPLVVAVPPSAIYRILSPTAAVRNASLANSLTSTTSGAYGERPPKAKRAVTRALAAAAMSALRSTMAMERAVGAETRDFVVGSMSLSPFWRRERTVGEVRKDGGGRVEVRAKMSGSRAVVRIWRRQAGRAWRVGSSCAGC